MQNENGIQQTNFVFAFFQLNAQLQNTNTNSNKVNGVWQRFLTS